MIAIIATMHVHPDKTDAFKAMVRELDVAVAAIGFHLAQDHFKAALGGMRA